MDLKTQLQSHSELIESRLVREQLRQFMETFSLGPTSPPLHPPQPPPTHDQDASQSNDNELDDDHDGIVVTQHCKCQASFLSQLHDIRRFAPSPFWQDRVKIADGAAKGLLYLHENNIIHRDVTPSNILLTHDNKVLLGDFGLARTLIEDSSYSTDCVGNLAYMAPEYAEFGKVSIKTDVYAFGVVLLQLITGLRTTDKRVGEKGLVGWVRIRVVNSVNLNAYN
ncbi:hypothetical protein Fmac_011740 [Flemingia macrophylla]|uniref:Protein kinase domain-containing protein n=1 Tax=Flemingia macrophylla TaxID=520843 RepID=A0ABD1MND7_9FABA